MHFEPTERPVAIVTGAGSGIGRAITRRLIDAGYRVALAGRHPDTLKATLDHLADTHGSIAVPTDITDPDSVDELFGRVTRQTGRVDLLVNNAGSFGHAAPVQDYELDVWKSTIETNLTGAFLCARQAFRQMIAQRPQGGRIINNGSLSAHVPRPNAIAYTAAKHGMTGLTKALALEGRHHGIACGQIDIGNATTEMTTTLAVAAPQPDGHTIAEPTISADHVAEAIHYMATLPLEANVLSLTVMATNMPFVGRG
jgi:NAD(P)-dependent dehydrogenase (short-subunit alcohol dehydrogenase family)